MSARQNLQPAADDAAAPVRAAVNGAKRSISFPDRAQVDALCRTRANSDNARWQAQVEARDALILAAASAGRQEGERAGYTAGWHWGAACGIIAGGSAVGALWVLWAPVQAVIAGWLA
jgi:hypothetical protein